MFRDLSYTIPAGSQEDWYNAEQQFQPFGLDGHFEELHLAALAAARAAGDAHGSGRIASLIGLLMATYRDDVVLPLEEAAPKVAKIARLLAPHVNLILLETLSTVAQAEGALKGTVQAGRPVWLSVSVHDRRGDRLRSGKPIEDHRVRGTGARGMNSDGGEAQAGDTASPQGLRIVAFVASGGHGPHVR
ncbi:homocysteine S-methyltransferase family protein [Rubellimicrobium mesophilum]|uniref:homocysteine S-methyltransferase family protein n=1 Tax=Rubellimicrobium mesophilum TaxID=1123067 RepID=UPI0009E80BA6